MIAPVTSSTTTPSGSNPYWQEHSAAAAIIGFLGGGLPTDALSRDVAGALLATTPLDELSGEGGKVLAGAARAIAELVASDPLPRDARAIAEGAIAVEIPADFARGPLSIALSIAGGVAAAREAMYRAWYGVNAYKRVRNAKGVRARIAALRKEPVYYAQHLEASQRRLDVDDLVRAAAKAYGRLLGWHAKMLPSTTSECRAAHGKNFYADRPPAIGLPGIVHPKCRCSAGPPWPNAPMLKAA